MTLSSIQNRIASLKFQVQIQRQSCAHWAKAYDLAPNAASREAIIAHENDALLVLDSLLTELYQTQEDAGLPCGE